MYDVHTISFQTFFVWVHLVIVQTIQFSISTLLSSIYPIYRTLSSAATPNQSGPEGDGNKRVLRIPQTPVLR